MNTQEMHRAQFSILRSLRHAKAVRYTELRRPTGLDSDVFKFHLRKMVQQGYVHKLASGEYGLTLSGKEFANNLSKERWAPQKQPKLSVALIAWRERAGRTEYLLQQRLRNPYFGFWGCLSGLVQWGETFEAAAERELVKQTGLTGKYEVKSFCRQTDRVAVSGEILEDKLFVLVEVSELREGGESKFLRGHNAWLTLEELYAKERHFPSMRLFADVLAKGESYCRFSGIYELEDY